MKVNDIITKFDTEKFIADLLRKDLGGPQYPEGSLSLRESVKIYNLHNISKEDAEKIVIQLEKTVSSALQNFKPKL